MSATAIHRDERTVAIENASYRYGHLLLSFGLLVLVAYRSFVHDEAPWDLMALVIIGGAVPSAYQAMNKVLTGRWVKLQLAALVAGALIAAMLAFARR